MNFPFRATEDKQVILQARAAGLRFTRNRRTILAVFLASTEPVTVNELWLRAKEADPRTSYSAAWRLLSQLAKYGVAHRQISPADGILRYFPVKAEG
jgi:Fe2+ or Zn2+ uptake regulation protein